MAVTLVPAWAQTPASTERAQERSQQQSDAVYRWIRYFAEQPRKVDPNKTRPKAETPPLARKPDVKPAEGPPQTAPVVNAAADVDTTPVAQPATEPQPSPAPQTAAAAAPAEPEPAVVAPTELPLTPLHVVEPAIPWELRNESLNTRVVVSFTVRQDGSVTAPTLVSGNNRRLNRSAMNAIAQWRFEPIQAERQTNIEFEFRQE
jgi:protein TonB